jgi:hypothetical protein
MSIILKRIFKKLNGNKGGRLDSCDSEQDRRVAVTSLARGLKVSLVPYIFLTE